MANSKRKCKHCTYYYDAESGVKTPGGWFCSWDHATDFAIEKAHKARERQQAKAARERDTMAKEVRKVERQRKMEVKPLSYWMKRAQAAFNAWIRAAKGGQCISCGRYHEGQMHAGHYRTTAAAPELRFEPDNVWPQCAPCNTYLSGNLALYRASLIHKIGLDRVEWLEGMHEPKRYRKEDYQDIEKDFKSRLKELQKQRAA